MNEIPPFSDDQERAIDFALNTPGAAWFMPPGMGKTRAWLETINSTSGRVLVMAPKLVCMTTWPEENKKWHYNFPMRFLHGRDRHLNGKEHVSVINYDAIPWLVEALHEKKTFPYEYVIYDELSKLKTVTSKRFKKWAEVVRSFKYRLGGTGTPVGNHLQDLFGEMFVCDGGRSLGGSDDVEKDHRRFIRSYFDKCEYTRALIPWHDSEERIMDKIKDRAMSFDINNLNMPELVHNPIYMDLPQSVVDHYIELQNDSVVEDLDVYAMNAAVKSGKKRQMASGAVYNRTKELVKLHNVKAERLKNIVDELQGRPVMVFFEYIHDYEAICQTLGPVPALYGQTKDKDTLRIKNAWNRGEIPVLAMHPRSAAYGLNMQDSGNAIVWYTVPWSYEMINQGIARLWRQGQKNKVFVHYLIVQNTEDERVYKRAQQKGGLHDRIMEGLL